MRFPSYLLLLSLSFGALSLQLIACDSDENEDKDDDKDDAEDCSIPKEAKKVIEEHSIEVEVEEKGDKPRVALRYEFSEGEVEVEEVEQSSETLSGQGRTQTELMETKTTKTYDVKEVDKEGVARVQKMEEEEERNLSSEEPEKKTENKSYSITPCGYRFDYESSDSSFNPVNLPLLPDEALGEGAEWTVRYEARMDENWDKPAKIETTFTIESIDDGQIELGAKTTMSLEGAMIDGSELSLMEATGSVEANFELSSPFEAETDETMEMKMTMKVKDRGKTMELQMKMEGSSHTE
jgi:hypothetical protein